MRSWDSEIASFQKLLVAVPAIFSFVIGKLILHVERLGHVEAIQPDLLGIDLLMPEVAGGGAGLFLELAVHSMDGLLVFVFTCQLV